MSKASVAHVLPEVLTFEQYFGSGTLEDWRARLKQHNEVIKRGLQMKLLRGASWLRISSLDTFMLLLHADALTDILESHVTFANRIRPLIRANPSAQGWYFHDKMLIQRRDWKLLARRVLNLVKLLGCADPGGIPIKNGSRHHNDDESMDGWPHQDRLCRAMRLAAGAYQAFAVADGRTPTLPPPRPPPLTSARTISSRGAAAD